MQQAFKFALDPTPEQLRRFASHAGAARFAFNWGLDQVSKAMDAYEAEKKAGKKPTTKIPNHFALCSLWTAHKNTADGKEGRPDDLAWVGQNSSGTYQAAMRDVATAWKNFNDSRQGRRKGRRVGRPKFKSRHRTKPSFQVHGGGLRVVDYRHLQLPMIGKVRTHEKTKKLLRLLRKPQAMCEACQGGCFAPVKKADQKKVMVNLALLATIVGLTPELLGIYRQTTRKLCKSCKGTGMTAHTSLVRANISKEPSGRWFASLTVDTHRQVRTRPSKRQREGGTIGIDWGVRDIATTSAGEVLINPRHLSASLDKLRRAQREMSRKQSGSKKREMARLRVAKLHARVANLREDLLEKWTSDLVHSHAAIVVEGWDVAVAMEKGSKGLPAKARRNRNQAMADTGIGNARWMIEHKAAWYGAKVTITGRHEPTARTCSRCGQVRTNPVRPADELFLCPSCGYSGNRRVNTARALIRLAHSDAPSSGESQNARGENVRPQALMRGGQSSPKREARPGPSGQGKTSTPDP